MWIYTISCEHFTHSRILFVEVTEGLVMTFAMPHKTRRISDISSAPARTDDGMLVAN